MALRVLFGCNTPACFETHLKSLMQPSLVPVHDVRGWFLAGFLGFRWLFLRVSGLLLCHGLRRSVLEDTNSLDGARQSEARKALETIPDFHTALSLFNASRPNSICRMGFPTICGCGHVSRCAEIVFFFAVLPTKNDASQEGSRLSPGSLPTGDGTGFARYFSVIVFLGFCPRQPSLHLFLLSQLPHWPLK